MSPLDNPCPCGAKSGGECVNRVQKGLPLPGRRFHLVRSCPSVWVKR